MCAPPPTPPHTWGREVGTDTDRDVHVDKKKYKSWKGFLAEGQINLFLILQLKKNQKAFMKRVEKQHREQNSLLYNKEEEEKNRGGDSKEGKDERENKRFKWTESHKAACI